MTPVRSLERLYRTHRRALYACALAVARCPDRAEDAVQEAFASLFAMRRRPRHLKAYAFRAVRNAAIDLMRRGGRERPLDEAELGHAMFNGASDPARDAQGSETRAALARGLGRLPVEQREAIVLHLYADLKFREIAQVLDRPMGTVVSWYRRGLERLKKEMENER